ncbi:ORF6N domain-containing protein [uncultured Draconibacterium sp.]|uniref:ORF6N domain-containing protein n=1 Tax=uncultured Draconibacterium sp. TaxID=1573823 RepID=UPI002AA7C98E|nr:ORF6N domain-containing protein [uncultured Draconibacterium sp.]
MELQLIQQKIYDIRGCRVMLDFDLASLYDVETRTLKQAVRRNLSRFPNDFMFQLKKDEWTELITICDKLPKSVKYSPALPMAFTEQGVAMLSSVLRSPIAIEINISIMRAFVLMREMALGYDELLKRIEQLEISTNAQFSEIYQALTELMKKPEKVERNPIGYRQIGGTKK